MVQSSRRTLFGLLALVLVLTACGRSSPNVTAEDGRGVERPSSGIWIPETRDVDPGRDMRRSDEGEDSDEEEDEERDAGTRQRDTGPDDEASGDGSTVSTTAPSRREPRPTPTASSSPERKASESSPSRDSSGSGSGSGRDDADDADDEEDEPTEPEVVGDCGSATSGSTPSDEELESAVDELRAEIERRWPDTQAGAWILQDPTEVHVGFTRAVASRLSQLCASFAYPQLLHGVRTELSDAELGELLETVEDDRDDLREGRTRNDLPKPIRDTKGRYVAAIEHASNGLVVTVEEPGEALLEAFRTHYTPRLHLAEGEFDEDGEPVAREEE